MAAAAALCLGFVRGWKSTSGRIRKLFAIGLATIAALYGCGSLAYVDIIGPIPAFNYTLEFHGFFLSLAAVMAGPFE